MSQNIAVIGQGYVGLPLAILLAESGFAVIGIDNDVKLIDKLNRGMSHIEDVDSEKLKLVLQNGNYQVKSEPEFVKYADVIVVCLPTPLNSIKQPDLTILLSALESITEHIKDGALLIIESTVEPGTTRNLIKPIVERVTKIRSRIVHIAFSPERIDPKNSNWDIANTPKLVSGLTDQSLVMAAKFYSRVVKNIVECSSVEVAEAAKLLENTFRLVNISFINEFFVFCNLMGIDVREVINAAATKPYGFMPFYPGIGVGGHCIPVDPMYLSHKSKSIGASTRFIDLAYQVNREMPKYFIKKAEEKIKDLKGKKILVIGVSYKPNISDVRETPVELLISGLVENGAIVSWHDDVVKEWNGEKSVSLSDNFDLAIIAVPHDYLDLTKLRNVPILNTRESI